MTLIASGVALGMPGNGMLYFSHWQLLLIAAAFAIPTAAMAMSGRRAGTLRWQPSRDTPR